MANVTRLSIVFAIALSGVVSCFYRAHSPYVIRDRSLVSLPLYFYPSDDTTRPPRAVVFFFGNDIGFWQAHQRLAERLSARGYAVIGFDVKEYLGRLPTSLPVRDSIFARAISSIVARSVHELGGDSVPLILAGHSFGADIALWTEANVRLPRVIGVMALAPTLRSHLEVTVLDLSNITEPHGPGSFSAADEIGMLPRGVRVALLRGSGDTRRAGDSSLVRAGGTRLDYRVIPFAGHSLKALTIAGPMIANALDRMLQEAPSSTR